MNCCANCFHDFEIIGFIRSNSTASGNCDYCGTKDSPVIDPRELEEIFYPVVTAFATNDALGIASAEGKCLDEKLQETWNIFRINDKAIVQKLLAEIVSSTIPNGSPLLTEPVDIEILYRQGVNADIHEKKWDSFANEIKYKNRFFLNETVDLELLKKLLGNLSRTYDPGKIFYRARVCGPEGLILDFMGKPPAEKATSGRANPNGIPYLYVSTDIETTIYESRSSYLDYLAIADFRVTEKLNVLSLRGVSETSPFAFQEHFETYIAHQKYLVRLEKELSKPVRRFDKELDYLPSQYLCEYVKSLGFDAIEYSSSLKANGINLAVFNDAKLEARRVKIHEITDVNLSYREFIP